MNRMVDLLFLLLLALAGLLTASWAGDRFGCLGYVFGPLIRAATTFGTLYAATLAWGYGEGLLFTGIPWLPACRDGRCQGGRLTDCGDYDPVKIDGDRWALPMLLRGHVQKGRAKVRRGCLRRDVSALPCLEDGCGSPV